MVDGDERQELGELELALFGGGLTIPRAYLRALKRSSEAASARLGIVIHGNEFRGYWLDGHSLGVLSCTGYTDEDAQISGQILQLDHLVSVDLRVTVDFNPVINRGDWGRVLLIEGAELFRLDASPGRGLPEKRVEIEAFIDEVLAALAQR